MGRRSTHTPEELRQLILGAAREVIESDGLAALSAREIARRIGYSAGTLYNIFDNLDDVRLTLQTQMLQDLVVQISSVETDGDAKRHVSQILKTYVDFTFTNRQVWNMLFEYRTDTEGPVPQAMHDSLDRVIAIVGAALAPVLPKAQRCTADQDARILWAGVHGITAIAANNRTAGISHETAARYVDRLTATYLRGLAAA